MRNSTRESDASTIIALFLVIFAVNCGTNAASRAPDQVDAEGISPNGSADAVDSSVRLGVPIGPYNLYGGDGAGPSSWDTPMIVGTTSFNLSSDFLDATGVTKRIASARLRKLKLLTHMTGGDHSKYITSGTFELAKWKTAMNAYNTPTIVAEIASAVADGTIIGNSVMDEPHHSSWGGVMTKKLVDQMCAYVKSIFPTLPAGVVHDHDVFEPTSSYATCDFLVDQYAHRKTSGDINAFRTAALALGARDRHAILFSLNILDGGIQDQDNDGVWECPVPATQGEGTFYPNCRMTADQVRDWGRALGASGCGLTMWRYDPIFMARVDNQTAFQDVATSLAKAEFKTCTRW